MPSIKCAAGELVKALRDITSVAKKGDLPILSNVLIEVCNRVSLTATNTVQEITNLVDMEHDGKFAVTVDAHRLAAIAGALDSGAPMTLEVKDDNLVIRSGRSRYSFQTLPADIFPRIPREKGTAMEIGMEFMAALDGVRHAVCTSDVQWSLCGVALHANKGDLEVFATDSNRMAIWNIGKGKVKDTIIPTAAIDLIMKTDCEVIDMTVGAMSVVFEYGDTILLTKVIESKITDYQRLLGWEPAITLSLPRKDAMAALNRLLLVSDDKDKSIVIDASEELAKLTNASGDEQLSCASTAPIRIGFKAQFLREAFAALSGDEVEIRIANPNAPVIIASPGNPEATLICGTFRV